MQKKHVILLCSTLAAVILLTGALSFTYARRAHRAENTLRITYESAILSSLKSLDELQSHIHKALLSRQSGVSAQLLSAVSSGAAGVQQSLALLPLQQSGVNGALKFANQLEDYADTLTGQVETGVTEDQAQTLEKLSAACENMMNALRDARDAWNDAQIGTGERTLMDENVAYPTLIYDGPFSDAVQDESALALQSLPEISREASLSAARDFLGSDRVIRLEAGTDVFGPIPCYGVTAQLKDATVQLAVTRQGGKVLWMFPEHADFEQTLTIEQCRENALAFLAEKGYGELEPLHFQVYDGLAVLNFAARQEGVVLYPDQIKVQLRMDTGEVIGIECRSYLNHHTPRDALIPGITEEDASVCISEKLTLTRDARLCLIPKNGREILCYEFFGLYGENEYRVYVNAQTGDQEEILKIVETEEGLLAV